MFLHRKIRTSAYTNSVTGCRVGKPSEFSVRFERVGLCSNALGCCITLQARAATRCCRTTCDERCQVGAILCPGQGITCMARKDRGVVIKGGRKTWRLEAFSILTDYGEGQCACEILMRCVKQRVVCFGRASIHTLILLDIRLFSDSLRNHKVKSRRLIALTECWSESNPALYAWQ